MFKGLLGMHRCCSAIVLVLLGFIAGCSPYVPVKGSVTLDGQPVGDATVMFVPKEDSGGPQPASGTDANGKFTLSTHNNAGALPGWYRVTVSKVKITVAGAQPKPRAESSLPTMPLPGEVVSQELLPVVYTDPKTTPIEIEVPEGGDQEMRIELKSNPAGR